MHTEKSKRFIPTTGFWFEQYATDANASVACNSDAESNPRFVQAASWTRGDTATHCSQCATATSTSSKARTGWQKRIQSGSTTSCWQRGATTWPTTGQAACWVTTFWSIRTQLGNAVQAAARAAGANSCTEAQSGCEFTYQQDKAWPVTTNPGVAAG